MQKRVEEKYLKSGEAEKSYQHDKLLFCGPRPKPNLFGENSQMRAQSIQKKVLGRIV